MPSLFPNEERASPGPTLKLPQSKDGSPARLVTIFGSSICTMRDEFTTFLMKGNPPIPRSCCQCMVRFGPSHANCPERHGMRENSTTNTASKS